VDALLFVAFTVVITSGLVISRFVMPAFGLQTFSSRSWLEIHNTSANLTLLLVALHFALHWSWVKNAFTRLLVSPLRRRELKTRPQPQSLPIPMERSKAL
jgi:cytochrome b561